MRKKKILLVTGSKGLIGSELVFGLHKNYDLVIGIDNNERSKFLVNRVIQIKLEVSYIKM